MNIGTVSPLSLAAKVWNSNATPAARTLTGMGTVLVISVGSNVTLSAGATVQISTLGTTTFGWCSVGVKAASAGAATINLFDGTNTYQLLSIVANGNGGIPCIAITNNPVASVVNNDGAHAGIYSYALGYLAQ